MWLENVGNFVNIAFKLQDDCGQLCTKEFVLQNSHPVVNLNFQSDLQAKISNKMTQGIIKNK